MRSVTKSWTQTISKPKCTNYANLNEAAYFHWDRQLAAVNKASSR